MGEKTSKTHNLPEVKAMSILDTYEGSNNYILKLKKSSKNQKNFKISKNQATYILENHDKTPKVARKWVDIDFYFSEKIFLDKLLSEPPKQVYIEKLLVEGDKAFHVWGKFFESEDLHDFYLPKASLLKKQKEVKIDYDKYSVRPPMEHQKIAIEKLVSNDKFILADDMGLGKTTSTVIASLEVESKKVLIICPASLKINWYREIKNYTDKTISIVEGKKWESADYVIVNYDIIKNFHDESNRENSTILKENFDLVIIDEAHYIQNKKAARTKLCNDVAEKIGRVWLLTGTPLTSRPINYFNLLELVDSSVAQNWMAYVRRYCNGFQFRAGNRLIWNVNGASNLEELRERTQPTILRRLKEDILDLPDKIRTPVYLNLQSNLYKSLMGEYYEWYRNTEESKSLALQFSKLMKVRQIIAQEKIQNTIEIANSAIDQEKKVIIFTNFTDTLNQFVDYYKKDCVYLDGSCSKTKRQEAVDKFQNDENVKVFIGNLKAAGVGITLTAAEVVIMNDLSFVPSDHSQAEDRAYRIGQNNKVSVYYPIFENTIEGAIYDILTKKKDIFETVMGDNVDDGSVAEEILNLITEHFS
jgi:SNF2 family DNA or RNA helicase